MANVATTTPRVTIVTAINITTGGQQITHAANARALARGGGDGGGCGTGRVGGRRDGGRSIVQGPKVQPSERDRVHREAPPLGAFVAGVQGRDVGERHTGLHREPDETV
jgi:hypothetical protein